VVAGVVAFGVFIAAATFGWLAFRPIDRDTVGGADGATTTEAIVSLRAVLDVQFPHPAATLSIGDTVVEGQPSSYGWDGAIVDTSTPTFDTGDFVAVQLPAVVSLEGDADWAEARLHPFDSFLAGEGHEIGLLDAPQPIEIQPGRYVMEIRAHWRDHGNPSFYFPLLVMGGSVDTPAPEVLDVVCSHTGADVSTSQVSVQADGVHVVVDNRGGFEELVLDPVDGYPLRFWSGSSGLDGPFVRELVPGRWRVGCVQGEQQDLGAVAGWAMFDVVDPNGFWTPTSLACGEGDQMVRDEPAPIPKVEGESPEQAVARVLGLREGDLVEEAGYRGSFRQPYRIVRSGEVVAWVLFSDWTQTYWNLTAGWACPGEGFRTERSE
jgi:hypothetical protein